MHVFTHTHRHTHTDTHTCSHSGSGKGSRSQRSAQTQSLRMGAEVLQLSDPLGLRERGPPGHKFWDEGALWLCRNKREPPLLSSFPFHSQGRDHSSLQLTHAHT